MTCAPARALLWFAAWWACAAAVAQTSDPAREDIKGLTVRIDATFPDRTGFGAGIVLGVQGDQIYIVTANHVIRDGDKAAREIKVQFRGHKEPLPAQPGAHYDIDQDLGVLIVPGARAHGIDTGAFSFDRVGDPTVLARGDPVFLAGHPQGVPWSITVTPDGFIEADEDSLRFESKSLFPGHSGGALLNFRLEIIGLLRSDQQPNGDALSITRVLSMLQAWGYPTQLRERFLAGTLETLTVGAGHSCYVNPRGIASCWGENDRGQLGLGTTTDTAQPSPVHGATVFVSISAGFEHTCAVSTGAQVLCWGDDVNGQLGATPPAGQASPSGNEHRSAPTPVSGNLAFSAISAGHDHTCGLTTQGQAYCWGDNAYGQLGTGGLDSAATPAPVTGGHTFRSVRAGTLFSCGIADSGSLYCWGVNSFGQLGDGSRVTRRVPVAVAGNLKFAAVSTGDGHACGVTADGKGYCWGDNAYGQLGLLTGKSSPVPVPVTGGLVFTSISAGRRMTYAISRQGSAYSWGTGVDELSLTEDQAPANAPARILGTESLTFKALSLTFAHACGLSVGGEIYCWGVNTYGELGNGSKETTVRPTLVAPQP